MGSWRLGWPGLLATLDGVGLCRFAYTPLIPFMIGAGLLTDQEAAYLGAANLAGYLLGAAAAGDVQGGLLPMGLPLLRQIAQRGPVIPLHRARIRLVGFQNQGKKG